MVFQQKVVSATNNKSKQSVQSPNLAMFELDANDDDDDFDKEMDTNDVQEPPKISNKKTPQAKTPAKQTPCKQTPAKQTPKQNLANQTPGKKTPAKQTPGKQTLAKQTPGKQTPAKQTPAKQTPGKQTPAKQTPGKQTPAKQTLGKQTPAKQTPCKQNLANNNNKTPGQNTPAIQKPLKQTPNKKNSLVPDKKVSVELASAKTLTATDSQVGKHQATPASKCKQVAQEFKVLKTDEDDEEEDNDDEEDDSKQNVLKSKLKQKIGNEQNDNDKEDDAEEEEDDDDVQEEDDDDDVEEEDDDEDDDKDDSKQNVLKNKLKQKKEKNQISQQVKNETSSQTETDDSLTKQNEDIREERHFMIRNLPNNVTCEEVKSLSDDITHVTLPDPAVVKKRHWMIVNCYVHFASKEKAEKNYATFKNQTLRGVPIECDFLGDTSRTLTEDFATTNYNAKRLYISKLPTDANVIQIAQLTPSATSILVTASTVNRAAYVHFDTEEEAAEAFEANKGAKINGKPVTVLYAVERIVKMNEDDDDNYDEEEVNDDEDLDEGDHSKQNVLKRKLKQKIGNEQNDNEEDDEDEDDDKEEDDDEEEDDDDNEEKVDNEEEDDDKDDSKQNVLKNELKQKNETSSQTETDDSLTKQNENLLYEKQFMIKNLPNDITCEEVKSLSDDITHVTLPDPAVVKKMHWMIVNCYVHFASKEIAENNYATFKNQTLRGVPIECDFLGDTSRTLTEDFATTVYNAKRLYVSKLPADAKVNQIAQLTPSATSILVNASTVNRAAYVTFDTEKEAAEAFVANEGAKINGKHVLFLYAVKRSRPVKRVFQQGRQPPFAKRPRQDLDALSQNEVTCKLSLTV